MLVNRLHRFVLTAACAALALLAQRAECQAGLFAFGTSEAEIYRIDADSGQILDTYPIPLGLQTASTRAGLAFDH